MAMNVDQVELSSVVGRSIRLYSHAENSSAISCKAVHTLSFEPAIQFLGIYPREMTSYTRVFIATL